jgi:phosphoribosylglycinamide formyltransferase-1
MTKVVVLISGGGSNLQSLIDKSSAIGIQIQAVISNKADAFGLKRAKNAGIKHRVVISKGLARDEFDAQLSKVIDEYQPDLIILAGFMRILTSNFVDKYSGKMLNIHPSLLPKFKGLNTHARAIQAGEVEHGASVHLVSSELDSGQIIMQKKVKVLESDTPETLAQKVLKEEHILYPQAIKKFIADTLC